MAAKVWLLTRPETCEVEGCTSRPWGRRRWPTAEDKTWLCTTHQSRITQYGDARADLPVAGQSPPNLTCRVEGCTRDREVVPAGGRRSRRCEIHRWTPRTDCVVDGCDRPRRRFPSGKLSPRCDQHARRTRTVTEGAAS